MTLIWVGRVLTVLFAAFVLIGSVAPKLIHAKVATDSLTQLGWNTRYVVLIGIIELICLGLHIWQRTSFLGAVLMTGLLGGAIASHLRAESPLFSHTLFGAYLGMIMWGGFWLRDERLQTLLPIVRIQ